MANDTKKQKKLTMGMVKQETNSKFSEKIHLEFEVNGQDVYVDIDKYFRPSKIGLTIEEINDAVSSNAYLKDPFSVFTVYLLKNFSTLDIPEVEEKQLICFEFLVDSGLLSIIINGFDPAELQKFNDQAKQAGIVMGQMLEEFKKIEARTKEEALDNA